MTAPVHTTASNLATTTIPSTTAKNSLIVVINSYKSTGTPSITSVKLGSASLSLATSKVLNSSGEYASYIYYLDNIAAAQTSVVLTATNIDVSSSIGGICIYEVPNLLSTGSLDSSATKNASGTTGTAYSSGSSGAPADPSTFFVGSANIFGSATAPSGFTNTTDAGDAWVAGYKSVTDGSAQTFSGSQSSSEPWVAMIAAFKIASSVNSNMIATMFP